MIRHTCKTLTELGFGILSLAVCAATLHAQTPPEAPGSPALLIAEPTNSPEGWVGPATLWIDGVEWSGTGSVVHEGVMGNFTWHGTEIQSYDFGELGTFQLSAIASTTFDVVESDYRWHTYGAIGRINGGTGVFEEAQGVFDLNGYTQWFTDGSAPPTAWYSGPGRVFGTSAVPEPLGLTLVSIGVVGLVAARQGWRKTSRNGATTRT